MINIDKYIDAVFHNCQTLEDYSKKVGFVEKQIFETNLDFFGCNPDEQPTYEKVIDKLSQHKEEIQNQWHFQNRNVFDIEKKRTFDEWFSEYEKEKEINPFSEAFFINDNINLTKKAVCDSYMWPFVKSFVTDWEQIEFKELANLAGKIDFLNYLLSEYKSLNTIEPKRTNNRIEFHFSKAEFVELVKSLIETKAVVGRTDKEVIEYFSKVLEVEIDSDSFHDTAYKFKSRKFGSETPFLMNLKTNLIKTITK